MKRIFFGIIWYLINVNVLAFVVTFMISFFLAAGGDRDATAHTMQIYQRNALWVTLIAIIFTVTGTMKGWFPGTKKKAA